MGSRCTAVAPRALRSKQWHERTNWHNKQLYSHQLLQTRPCPNRMGSLVKDLAPCWVTMHRQLFTTSALQSMMLLETKWTLYLYGAAWSLAVSLQLVALAWLQSGSLNFCGPWPLTHFLTQEIELTPCSTLRSHCSTQLHVSPGLP